jgi:hypothetical protein
MFGYTVGQALSIYFSNTYQVGKEYDSIYSLKEKHSRSCSRHVLNYRVRQLNLSQLQ